MDFLKTQRQFILKEKKDRNCSTVGESSQSCIQIVAYPTAHTDAYMHHWLFITEYNTVAITPILKFRSESNNAPAASHF